MASEIYKSFSLAIAAAVALTLVFAGDALPLKTINPFCKTAPDAVFCTSTVKGARTRNAAITNAILASIAALKRAKPVIDGVGAIMPPTLLPITKTGLIKGCRENYDTLIYGFDDALKAAKQGGEEIDEVQTILSIPVFIDCVDEFANFNATVPPALVKLQQEFDKHIENCLSFW